ncbi:hypothetical protein RGUI_1137 [Rhodovulum sp. P5]|nr:hypothetical protein RGUI_1137 [Rhodovulum sp. P5]
MARKLWPRFPAAFGSLLSGTTRWALCRTIQPDSVSISIQNASLGPNKQASSSSLSLTEFTCECGRSAGLRRSAATAARWQISEFPTSRMAQIIFYYQCTKQSHLITRQVFRRAKQGTPPLDCTAGCGTCSSR